MFEISGDNNTAFIWSEKNKSINLWICQRLKFRIAVSSVERLKVLPGQVRRLALGSWTAINHDPSALVEALGYRSENEEVSAVAKVKVLISHGKLFRITFIDLLGEHS